MGLEKGGGGERGGGEVVGCGSYLSFAIHVKKPNPTSKYEFAVKGVVTYLLIYY